MKKIKFLILFIIVALFSCKLTQNKPFVQTSKVEIKLRNHLLNKLNRYNSIKINSDFDIWTNQISEKDNNAIFNFGRVGSHGSKKNFFIYSKDKIHFLDDLDTENMFNELNVFFNENNYSAIEKKSCIQKITKIINEKNANTF